MLLISIKGKYNDSIGFGILSGFESFKISILIWPRHLRLAAQPVAVVAVVLQLVVAMVAKKDNEIKKKMNKSVEYRIEYLRMISVMSCDSEQQISKGGFIAFLLPLKATNSSTSRPIRILIQPFAPLSSNELEKFDLIDFSF